MDVTGGGQVLSEEATVLHGSARTRHDAITEAGRLLVATGAVEPPYVETMHERERSVSTHMGNLLAIPHGTHAAKDLILRTAVSFVRYPAGLDWGGHPVEFVVGIAAAGDDHLDLLSRLAEVFIDDDRVRRLRAARRVSEVSDILGGGE
jgi:mannitol PTS system EIICBA or EIICB component